MFTEEESIKKSIELFEKILSMDPENIFANRQLSKLYFRNNQQEQMLEAYNKILEIDPGDSWTLKRLGDKYHQEKNFEGALDCFSRLKNANPENGYARMKYMDIFKEQASEDEESKGKLFYNELKKYKDRFTSSHDCLASFDAGYAYLTFTTGFTLTEEEIQNAMACFKQGIAQDKDSLWCYWGLKQVYVKVSLSSDNQMYSQAIQICEKALMVNPQSAQGHYELAEAYNENYEANMKNDAIKEYRAAIAIDPEFIEAHFRLAGIYRMKRMYEKATESYQMVLDIDPTGNYARDALRSLVFIERNKETAEGS